MQKKILPLYGITLLQIISYAGKSSDSFCTQVHSTIHEELIIEKWKQMLQDFILIEAFQNQIFDFQIQLCKNQKQKNDELDKNSHVSHIYQNPEEPIKILNIRMQTFEARLNQYMSYEFKMSQLKKKIYDNQEYIASILKKTVQFIRNHSEDHLISENISEIVKFSIIKLEKIQNFNENLDLNSRLLSSVKDTLYE